MKQKTLRQRLTASKTFNYNVYLGQGEADGTIEFDKALDEIIKLFKRWALEIVNSDVPEDHVEYGGELRDKFRKAIKRSD